MLFVGKQVELPRDGVLCLWSFIFPIQIKYFVSILIILLLKVASEEIIPLPCKCSILLGLTFVEIKNSFTKTLLDSNSKNFRMICYWKGTDESEPV